MYPPGLQLLLAALETEGSERIRDGGSVSFRETVGAPVGVSAGIGDRDVIDHFRYAGIEGIAVNDELLGYGEREYRLGVNAVDHDVNDQAGAGKIIHFRNGDG